MGRSERRGPPAVEAHRFELENDFVVLVGKTDADNDRLSLKVAQPNDWWFHVHSLPGSHVILQCPQGMEADKDTLKIAAAIAAWYSKARNGGLTQVSYTQAKNVSKPRGAKAGTVSIRKEGLLKVKPGLPS